jgi:hypothetical protein
VAEQLRLPLDAGERWELGLAVVSWVEAGVVIEVTLWPCCIDTGWPWWRPLTRDRMAY